MNKEMLIDGIVNIVQDCSFDGCNIESAEIQAEKLIEQTSNNPYHIDKRKLIDDAKNIMIKSSKLDAKLVENSSVILGFFQKDAEDIVNHVFDALKRTDSKLIVKTDTKWITKALPDLPDKAKPMLVNSKRIMSERVLVLVDTLDGSTAEAFAKYNHYPNSNKWHIEGYQGEWNVLGWHCLPTV